MPGGLLDATTHWPNHTGLWVANNEMALNIVGIRIKLDVFFMAKER